MRGLEATLWKLYARALPHLYSDLAFAYIPVTQGLTLGQYRRWRRLALVHLQPGPTLEVGCGPADLFAEIHARTGMAPLGVDRSRAMLRLAAKRLRTGSAAPSLSLIQADATALPFADESFSNILSLFPAGFALCNAFYGEAYRLLRPGGKLILGAPWVSWRCKLSIPPFDSPGLAERANASLQALGAAQGLCAEAFAYRCGPITLPVLVFTKPNAPGRR